MRFLILLTLLPATAYADDLDTEVARKHFAEGAAHYDAGRYRGAVWEFETAYAAHPTPKLAFNIGRCYDRLEEWQKAIEAYERYLTAFPGAEDATEIRARVEVLRARIPKPVSAGVRFPPPTPAENRVVPSGSVTIGAPYQRRLLVAPAVLGAVTLALGGIGAGLLGSAAADYAGLERTCSPSCAPGLWAGLPAREHVGEAFLGAAAMVAVVDVVLWIKARRGR